MHISDSTVPSSFSKACLRSRSEHMSIVLNGLSSSSIRTLSTYHAAINDIPRTRQY